MRGLVFAGLALLVAFGSAGAETPRVVVDDFEDVTAWSAHPASGVNLSLVSDDGAHGRALRLDFAFSGGGYAVARRAVSLDLPENYRFRFAIRGKCLPNDLELKLIDSSGDNVWWCNRRMFRFPARWDSLSTRKRQISFAWGPVGGGEIRHVAAIEVAVTAGQGGTGSVWLDDFTLEALPPPDATPPAPRATASSARAGQAAARACDRDPATAWSSAPGDRRPWLALDLGAEREYGGLVLDWVPGRHAADYDVETSRDGRAWRVERVVRGSNGGRDWLDLPEMESRHVRVRARGPVRASLAIREIAVQPLEWSATREKLFEAIAKDSRRGTYPRGISGEPSAWTVVGVDGGKEEGLLGADGALETGKASWSVEPFLLVDGRLVTWADVATEHRLQEGDLPIPTVQWKWKDLSLTVTALAAGDPERAGLWARYRVENLGARPTRGMLFLALRPFQVNPPVQFLNTPGGTAPVREIAREGRIVRVNGDRGLVSLTAPDGFGAATFDQGDVVADFLRFGRLPTGSRVTDSSARASAALAYHFELQPRAAREVVVVAPLNEPPQADRAVLSDSLVRREFGSWLERTAKAWRARERGVPISLPPGAGEVERTLRAQLGWILVNRDGPAIQPGSRSYERSWIRDGSLTSSALLRMGAADVARDFADWFASFQYDDGKVPCCVDQRGADPVPEHDSHGELIYLIAETWRYTGDRALVERHWRGVVRAVGYLDSLRRTRRTAEWRASDQRLFFGLLPPSISHEGYSAKPMHSYWDDFWALRGLDDAVVLAGTLGRNAERARFVAIRDEFARDLGASVRAAMAKHKIDYVPGCADLGDFDATSTTIALAPGGAERVLPPAALRRTFEKYWEFFRDRRDGKKPWEAYTPYEIRNVGAFVRLGWRERANELLRYFLADRTPPGWAQWAEVVWNHPQEPKFIGDLPHTWVGSDYVRSVLDMLAYVRDSDSTLVLAAGVPWAWVAEAPGVTVRDLPTPLGKLSYTLREVGDDVEVRIADGLRVPRGGIVVNPPFGNRMRAAVVNGRRAAVRRDGSIVAFDLPALVRWTP